MHLVLAPTCTISVSVVYNLFQHSFDVVHGAIEWMERKYFTIFILIANSLVSVIYSLKARLCGNTDSKSTKTSKDIIEVVKSPHFGTNTEKCTIKPHSVWVHTQTWPQPRQQTHQKSPTSFLDPKHPSWCWHMRPDHKTLHPKLRSSGGTPNTEFWHETLVGAVQ